MATVAPRKARSSLTPVHLLYALLAIELVTSIGMALAFRFRAPEAWLFLPQLWAIMLVVSGPLSRRIGHPRIGGACETVGLFYGQGFALVALLYPMTAIARPFSDHLLAAADQALGFDWPAFAALLRDHPSLLTAANVIYFSFGWQGAIIMPALFLVGDGSRAWQAILAANLALVATMFIYPLFPAQGTFIHYGIRPADYPNMHAQIAWAYGPVIEAIRDNGARVITRALMAAFVSFPSYHACAAVIFVWATWPMRWLRWPALALNISMCISALIIGGHYLVDLLGGFAVAAVAIAAAKTVFPSREDRRESREVLA